MTALALVAIATTMILAPTVSFAQMEAKPTDPKEPKDKKKCSTKIQVRASGVTNGTEYTATILDTSIIKTAINQETLSFTFNFGKAQKAVIQEVKPGPVVPGICPASGSELQGDINGKTFDVTIGETKKPTRVSVDVSDIVVEPPVEEPPVDPEPNGTDPIPPVDTNNTNTTI